MPDAQRSVAFDEQPPDGACLRSRVFRQTPGQDVRVDARISTPGHGGIPLDVDTMRTCSCEEGSWDAIQLPGPVLRSYRARARLSADQFSICDQTSPIVPLRKAAERLATLHTPEGAVLPPNVSAELQRNMARLGFIVSQIKEIEAARQKRLEQEPETQPHAMVRHLARVVGVGVETADISWSMRCSRKRLPKLEQTIALLCTPLTTIPSLRDESSLEPIPRVHVARPKGAVKAFNSLQEVRGRKPPVAA
jgi:hypothetical protein